MTKVIFDTDPGIDDAMAMRLIQCSPELDLIGITTVFGNASVETTTHNALHLAARFGIDVPVVRGAGDPLSNARLPEPTHVHGHNGLGDIDLSGFALPALHPLTAAEFLVEKIRAHPGEITLIAVAPLTNLALALRLAPDIADKVAEVVVMGGAFGLGPRRGNVTPVAEANIINDPHAADIVVTADWPVTMIGLDVTMRCILSTEKATDLESLGGPPEIFLAEIARPYSALYKQNYDIDGCCLHDVAAVAYAIDPGLLRFGSGPMRVVTEGISVGQTIMRPDSQRFPPGAWDGYRSQRAAEDVDTAALVDLFLARLLGSAR